MRDLAEILASFEKLWRRSSGKSQWEIERTNYFKAQTVEGRCELWAEQGQPVGLAYNRVKDALSRGYADRIHYVEFDDLTTRPGATMKAIYEFLDIPGFSHDFESVAQYTQEDDKNIHRIEGLHSIRSKVEPVPKSARAILGSVEQKYRNQEIWRK